MENLRQLYAFLSDTVLMTGFGFRPPEVTPAWGVRTPAEVPAVEPAGPTIAVLYYRAQELAGNTAYIDALCAAIPQRRRQALPVFCTSLRTPDPELLALLVCADALVVTVLAAGGAKPAAAAAVAMTPAGTWNTLRRWMSRSCRRCV